MIKTNFPINDLRRRRFQTSITIITLTLSVASTLFLLQLSSRLGFGSSTSGLLTAGLTTIFSQFIIFIGVLIFIIGAVLTAFTAFLMMAQRTRDFGLIKAVGCPNNLIGGYLMAELLTTTAIGCILGIGLGFLFDYGVSNVVFSTYQLPNFLFAPLVFTAFFILALIFGLQPVIKASKMSPLQALSPVNYYGLTSTAEHKALSKSALTWRIASRSLVRRQSASLRIVVLLSIMFILLTVSVGGGIIASGTTSAWVEQTVDKNVVLVAHSSMGDQYKLLLAKFSGAKETGDFNYSDQKLSIPQTAIQYVAALSSVSQIDPRLVLKEHVQEISNFTVNPDTEEEIAVGDNRQGDSLVVGVDTAELTSSWFVQGQFLSGNDDSQAVIGDSVAHAMYSIGSSTSTLMSNPLVEGMAFDNKTFNIVGVCVDPLNNGQVAYVPLQTLMNITSINSPNILLVKLNSSTDRSTAIAQIKTAAQSVDPDLNVYDLNDVVTKNTVFLTSNWQTIMLLPLFTLSSAALCLVGYMILAVDEQHQEFAVLRAVGAKSRLVISILSIQSIIVLFSSFAAGLSLGTMITIIFLLSQPIVTALTLLQISGLLLATLTGMFLLSLIPAIRLARSSILKIMT